MQRKLDRREFLVRSAAVTGGTVLSLSAVMSGLAESDISQNRPRGIINLTWYALDPEWGDGLPHCPVDAHTGPRSCHGCNACHAHGENKLFPTAEAADANRAHLGCKCQVVEGGQLPESTWMTLFGAPDNVERDQVDRRWDWVSDALGEEPPMDMDFAHAAFERTWARTDKPVLDGLFARTWVWAPKPFTPGMYEDYENSPGGERLVQYFDKSRMEINNPGGDQNSIWFVTNGLLVNELISGMMQVGDNSFVELDPADVNVAGDPNDPNGPMYSSFGDLLDEAAQPVGTVLVQRVNRDGDVSDDESLAAQNVQVGHVDDVTNHGVAAPFWELMNSSGLIYENGQFVEDQPLFPNPVFATGRPTTEAYWADVLVGGELKLVLMQCFERRCLTYTPSNSPGWRVEAGNVGLHYHTWRYGVED